MTKVFYLIRILSINVMGDNGEQSADSGEEKRGIQLKSVKNVLNRGAKVYQMKSKAWCCEEGD